MRGGQVVHAVCCNLVLLVAVRLVHRECAFSIIDQPYQDSMTACVSHPNHGGASPKQTEGSGRVQSCNQYQWRAGFDGGARSHASFVACRVAERC